MRQINGLTRLAMDLNEPLAVIESLTFRLELAHADIGALSKKHDERPHRRSLERSRRAHRALSNDVGALSNSLVDLEGDFDVLS